MFSFFDKDFDAVVRGSVRLVNWTHFIRPKQQFQDELSNSDGSNLEIYSSTRESDFDVSFTLAKTKKALEKQ